MELITPLSKVIIAASIGIVWVFRFDNIIEEFKQYVINELQYAVHEEERDWWLFNKQT